MLTYQILPAGDKAVNVTFERQVSVTINQQIAQLQQRLTQLGVDGITGFLPAFRTLTVFYEPAQISLQQLKATINTAMLDGHQNTANVATRAHLTSKAVIERHSQPDYLIYMLGFLPGFAYLGGLDPQIATPRLATPRLKIAPGSVGIAGEQTGMYPIESPGGWQIIGRTPLRLFQPESDQPFYYQTGDYIHFDVISRAEYDQIASHLADYHVRVEPVPEAEVEQHGA